MDRESFTVNDSLEKCPKTSRDEQQCLSHARHLKVEDKAFESDPECMGKSETSDMLVSRLATRMKTSVASTDRGDEISDVGSLQNCKIHSSSPLNVDAESLSSSQYLSSTESLHTSLESRIENLMAEIKHRVLVSIMKQVYAVVNLKSASDARTHAGTQSNDLSRSAYQSTSGQSQETPKAKGKRAMRDRDSPPPDEHGGKRGPGTTLGLQHPDYKLLLACPFHKHDPTKYSTNNCTGKLYRTCVGPGFKKVAYVK